MTRRFRWATGFVAVAVVMAAVTGAAAVIGGGTPPATFSVALDGQTVVTSTGYELEGALVSGKKEYTLRLSLALTDDGSAAQAFQSGQTFATAEIKLLGQNLQILKTYTLTNATVVAYRQSGAASTNAFTQELVLKSKTLAIT